MISIDPMAGTHFDGKEIVVTKHAKEGAVNRFGVKHNVAESFVKTHLRKSQYIGKTYSEEGDSSRLFAYRRMAFVVDAEKDAVITVYERHLAHERIRNPIEILVKKEIKKSFSSLRKIEREAELKKADLMVESAQCKRRIIRTTSDNVIRKMNERLQQIKEEMQDIDHEVLEYKREHAKLMKGVVAYA